MEGFSPGLRPTARHRFCQVVLIGHLRQALQQGAQIAQTPSAVFAGSGAEPLQFCSGIFLRPAPAGRAGRGGAAGCAF